MKKILLALTFIVAITSFATAQDLHFGVQMSPSFSWMRTDNSKINRSGTATGLKLSLIAENRFSQSYAVSTGIGFHFNSGGRLIASAPSRYWTKSWNNFDVKPTAKADSAAFSKDTRFRYGLTFVEIPLGLKMRTPETGTHIRYFVEPNLVLGVLSNAKGAIVGSNNLDQDKINIKPDVATFMISWGAGVGGEFTVSNNTALVGGLYFQHGFTDVTGDNAVTFDADGKSNPRTDNSKGVINSLTIRLGVMF
jgi:Outer membrane protein beta-barrel domain